MGRQANKLTDTWLKKARGRSGIPDGVYADGAGLYLRVQGENRSWLFIYRDGAGKRREMGLGSASDVGLKDARRRADEARKARLLGLDPIVERKGSRAAAVKAATAEKVTFKRVAEEWISANSGVWSKGVGLRYRGYIKNWCGGRGGGHERDRGGGLRDIEIGAVGVEDVVATLKPVWGTPTGLYVRSFIERVIDYAVVRGLREGGLNPARLKGNIAVLMPRAKVATVYHDALDWRLVPAVYARLRAMDGVRPAALRLLILTGLRSNEVRSLRWSDVRDDRIIIDGSKYKTRREHQVPLTDAMREVLNACRSRPDLVGRGADALVFTGRIRDRPLSAHTFEYLLRGPLQTSRVSDILRCVVCRGRQLHG